MITIIIADDHPLMREGVKVAVQQAIDMQVIGEAANRNDLLSILQENLPDILILDIHMPGKNGLEILEEVQNLFPNLPVLILSMYSEKRFALRALKAGAMGYLNKSNVSNELEKAIRRIVSRKRKYINEEVAELLSVDLQDKKVSTKSYEALSDRELQVLCEIARGREVAEIADNLSLSPQTVYSYRTRIKKKLHLNTNVEITRYAIEQDLVD